MESGLTMLFVIYVYTDQLPTASFGVVGAGRVMMQVCTCVMLPLLSLPKATDKTGGEKQSFNTSVL